MPASAAGRAPRSRRRDDRARRYDAHDTPSAVSQPRLAVISAGISDPSSTRMLADRIAQRSLDLLQEDGAHGSVSVIELAPLALDIARATVSGFPSEPLQAGIERIAAADAVIASTPVYKAGDQRPVQVVRGSAR